MANEDFDRNLGRLMAIASVGTEMVVPIIMGIGLDIWLGWMPVLSIVGVISGLALGIYHLALLNRPKP